MFFCADASDLDSVSHGSLDSTNDSAERASIDTDFTKMDSSDDGSSTGALSALTLGHSCVSSLMSFLFLSRVSRSYLLISTHHRPYLLFLSLSFFSFCHSFSLLAEKVELLQ